MSHTSDEAALALATEQQIYDVVTPLEASDRIGCAKVLLTRHLSHPELPESQIVLQPIAGDDDWRFYTQQRISVESRYGVAENRARAMVDELHARAERVGMTMFFALNRQEVVGAIGSFRLPAPDRQFARLQEVDVFPAWRGNGYGTSMLVAILRRVLLEGCSTVAIGADEDDWPLSWYRRHAFKDVLRVRSIRNPEA